MDMCLASALIDNISILLVLSDLTNSFLKFIKRFDFSKCQQLKISMFFLEAITPATIYHSLNVNPSILQLLINIFLCKKFNLKVSVVIDIALSVINDILFAETRPPLSVPALSLLSQVQSMSMRRKKLQNFGVNFWKFRKL